jgi:hypothetical protein
MNPLKHIKDFQHGLKWKHYCYITLNTWNNSEQFNYLIHLIIRNNFRQHKWR